MLINKILDDNYMDLLVENSLGIAFESPENTTWINNRFSVAHIPVSRFNMCLLGEYPYHIFPTLYTLDSQISLIRSSVTEVRNNPVFDLNGQGVLIGFLDTGIDYCHEVFQNPDGSTRLFSIWDQTVMDGEKPEGFTFGAEYNKTMIDQALQSSSPLSVVPSEDEVGHGTMMAGIAAGSIKEEHYFSGVAPRAELIMVKLAPAKKYNRKIWGITEDVDCYQETNILLGIEYILSVAARLNRPLVLCIGMGSSQGAHEGHSMFATWLNYLCTIPRIGICVSAGNEGNKGRHYSGTINPERNTDTFELRVGEADKNFFLEIWQNAPCRVMVEFTSPTGEIVYSIFPRFDECREYSFIFCPTRIFINNIILEEETGEQLILVRFEDAFSGIWTIRVTAIDDIFCEFNAWLTSGNIISEETYFLRPNPYTTITSPGNSRNPLTVGAYNQLSGSILISSSRGYTPSNLVKPDIVAPGYALPCPVRNQAFGVASGTGAAAAHTAGIIALLMEWAVEKRNYMTITGRDINRLLIRGAIRNSDLLYPNPIWGYGKINIMEMFSRLI